MALANPTTAVSTTTAPGTSSVTQALTMVAGTTYMMLGVCANTTRNMTSVTDNLGGNTWVVRKSDTTTGVSTDIASCKCAVGGSATITINLGPSTPNLGETLVILSSTELAGTVDKAVSAVSATSPASSGSTGTLTVADEIACFAVKTNANVSGWSPNAGWTQVVNTAATKIYWVVTTATTALTGGGTYSTSTQNSCVCCTFGAPGRVPRSPAVDYADPAMFMKAWRSRIFVPRLWLPEGVVTA